MVQARTPKRVKLDHPSSTSVSGQDATQRNNSGGGTRASNSRIGGGVGGGEKSGREERGGQAFSVPDLPLNFDGVPLDGGQYLAQVR